MNPAVEISSAAPGAAPDSSGVPGVVIAQSPAASRRYIGSPGLAVLPGGEYVATHDLFGPGSTWDRTRVYLSTDRGRIWAPRGEIEGQWWSSLFVHEGALNLMGTSREYGFAVIRRSTDGGESWTSPTGASTGLLHGDGRYHCAPVPVLRHAGRLWRAMEDAMGPGGWGAHFRAFMTSAPADADLLRADSWTTSERLARNPDWLGGRFGGWLEGNAVAGPDGRVVDLLRVDFRDAREKAAWVEVSGDGKRLRFDPETGFPDFPGGCKKFTVRRDPVTGMYWSLSNYVPPGQQRGRAERTRNTLALIRSPDLREWAVRDIILHHPDPERHGFQYVDWLFDGEDLIAVARTAHDDGMGGAHNQHDANYLTFHRIPRFRERGTASEENLRMAESLFTGNWPAMVTPMHDDGRLRLESVPPLVEKFVREGAGGIYLCGSTGQGPLLTLQERQAMAEATIAAARGRLPVMVHVGAIREDEAVELARHAAAAGASAVSSVAPMYYPPTLASTMALYHRIAAASDLPFYAYSFALPGTSPDAYAEVLLKVPHARGLKFTSVNTYELARLKIASGGRLNVLSGADESFLAAQAQGADGAIGSTQNIALPLFDRALAAARAGRWEEGRARMLHVVRLVHDVTIGGGIGALHAILTRQGIPCGQPRPPLARADEAACAWAWDAYRALLESEPGG